MARILVVLDGATAANGSPLLMHNERLADPIDPYTRSLAELTGKRKKTERDHEEIGRREFMGSGYWLNDDGPAGARSEPFIPTWNIVRCLQDAATRYKLGRQVLRGVVPVDDATPLLYDGSRDAEELWKSGLFHSRKGVGVGGKRVIRTRVCFSEWKLEAHLEVDLTMLDPETINVLIADAGRFVGIGDNRPRFGRFTGTADLVGDAAEFGFPDVLDDIRARLVGSTARAAIEVADAAHAEAHPNGKDRKKRVTKKAGLAS